MFFFVNVYVLTLQGHFPVAGEGAMIRYWFVAASARKYGSLTRKNFFPNLGINQRRNLAAPPLLSKICVICAICVR